MSDQVTLTISHQSHNQVLVDGLWSFLVSKYLVEDVPWGGGFLKAHQLILDVFLPPGKPGGNTTISDENRDHLEALLEFLYRGTVTVQQERLEGLLLLAREMDFQMLVDAVLTSSGGQSKAGESEGHSANNVVSYAKDVVLEPLNQKVDSELSFDGYISVGDQPEGNLSSVQTCEPEIEIVVLTSLVRSPPPRIKGNDAVQMALPSFQKEPIPKFKCPDCKYESTNADTVNSHRAVVHPEIGVVASTSTIGPSQSRPEGVDEIPLASPSLPKKQTPKFKCPDCKLESSNADVIKSHRAVVHSEGKPFRCALCEFVTDRQPILKRHVNELHPANPSRVHKRQPNHGRYFCTICKQRFDTGNQLDAHLAAHREVGIFKCPLCFQAFSQNKYLVVHLSRAHRGQDPNAAPPAAEVAVPITCDICGMGFNNPWILEAHVARVHANPETTTSFACEVCSQAFNTHNDLVDHTNVHSEERPFKCLHCDQGFKSPSDLTEHVTRIHDAEGPFKCPQCDQGFKGPSDVTEHVDRIHDAKKMAPPDNPLTIPCKTCGKLFATFKLMTEHTAIHSQERPHKCPHCNKSFVRPPIRDAHVARVHGRVPGDSKSKPYGFRCKQCAKQFISRPDLINHHCNCAQDPKYKCPHCDKRNNVSSNRRLHAACLHSKGTSYHCEPCNKRFKTRSDLVQHRCVQVQELKYKCLHCDKVFSEESSLKSHLSHFHDSEADVNTRK